MKKPLFLITFASALVLAFGQSIGGKLSLGGKTGLTKPAGGGGPTCSGYAYYSTIVLPVPGSTLTNFPLVVSGTLADIKTVANSGKVQNTETISVAYSHAVPADFVLRNTDGTTAISNFEFAQYSATAGTYELWINYPSLTTGGGTIYACYGNAAVTTFQGNVAGTWNSAFKVVQHLSDGSTLQLGESTANYSAANNGATATTGKVDGGAAEDGFGQWFVVTNASNIISAIDTWTVEGWWKGTSFGTQPVLWAASAGSSKDIGVESSATGTTLFWFVRGSGSNLRTVNADISDNAWHHVAVVKTASGDNGVFYLDGVAKTTASGVLETTPTIANIDIKVGAYGTILEWIGSVDEFRVSNAARSADWVAASVANQVTPKTLSAAVTF